MGLDLCVYRGKLIPRRKERVNYDLCEANGTTNPTYGWLSLSLNLGLRRDFTWRFVVANVTHPLIGVHDLFYFGFLVDCKHNRLLDEITLLSVPAPAASSLILRVKIITGSTLLDYLTAEFQNLQNTVHHMRTIPGSPVTCRPQRLATDRLVITKADFNAMFREGTARHSKSSWSYAIHIVPKDNSWPSCGDYSALNARTIPDRYSISHIHDYSHQLFRCSVFSKIDLLRAYDQESPSIPTIYRRPPLPLHLAHSCSPSRPSTCTTPLRRFMGILHGLDLFRLLGQHPVFSRSLQEHEQHLWALSDRLQRYGILNNPEKCIFQLPEVTLLGCKVSAKGSLPLEERVTHLQDCHRPKTASQLHRFLGMLNFYKRFLPHAGATQAPLVCMYV
jgi:cleavage and polyadenylation specificity factor subunit 1